MCAASVLWGEDTFKWFYQVEGLLDLPLIKRWIRTAALAQFETWYAQTHTTPFWTLFEHYIPETPRVDF